MNDALAGNAISHAACDLSDEAVHDRLSPAAWKFFRRLMRTWSIPEQQAARLLGVAPEMLLDDFCSVRLCADQLIRISYLAGIYIALRALYRPALADRWVSLPNTNPMFDGLSPLEYMVSNGNEALRNVRKLLDARCAGN